MAGTQAQSAYLYCEREGRESEWANAEGEGAHFVDL